MWPNQVASVRVQDGWFTGSRTSALAVVHPKKWRACIDMAKEQVQVQGNARRFMLTRVQLYCFGPFVSQLATLLHAIW